jgi:biopolymer transport protein TolQ
MNFALESVRLACDRAAVSEHGRLSRGVNGLATVASVAPFVGMFGTIIGIVNSFVACDGSTSTCLGAVASRLADAWPPTALALVVAMFAYATYHYLRARLDYFVMEMQSASLELLNRLPLSAPPATPDR